MHDVVGVEMGFGEGGQVAGPGEAGDEQAEHRPALQQQAAPGR